MELPDMEKIAAKPGQLPNVFLGEFPQFGWGFERCTLDSGMAGIRFIFFPTILPFIKFSLPFHPMGLEKLRDDIGEALTRFENDSTEDI